MKIVKRLGRLTVGVGVAVAITLSSPLPSRADPPRPALSQDQIDAIVDGDIAQGLVYYKRDDFAKAVEAFRHAYSLKPLPAIGYNLTKSLEKLNKLLEAEQAAKELLSRPAPTAPEQLIHYTNTQKLLTDLTARIPTVTIVVGGPTAKTGNLKIDGTIAPLEQPQRVNPGSHKISVSAEGFISLERTLTVKEHEALRLELAMQPRGSSLRTIGLLTGAAGLVGVGVGSALGVLAIQKNNESNHGPCVGDACTDDGIKLRSASIAMGNGSTAAFLIGGVAFAAGVTMVLIASKPGNAPSAQVGVGPRGVLLSGTW